MRIFWLSCTFLLFSFGLSWHLSPDDMVHHSGKLAFTSAHASSGDSGEGGDNPEPTKTIALNKQTYSARDLKEAAKSLYEDKDIVLLEGTTSYSGRKYWFQYQFISLARYTPELAAELLNKWLRAKTFAQKYQLVKKIRRKISKQWIWANKYGTPAQRNTLENAYLVATGFRAYLKVERKLETQDRQNGRIAPEVFRSDIRSKRDLRHLATLSNGIAVYKYRYVWSDRDRIGVIAQDVLKIAPEAVKTIKGMLYVDYGRLFASQELRAELRQIGLSPVFWRATNIATHQHYSARQVCEYLTQRLKRGWPVC